MRPTSPIPEVRQSLEDGDKEEGRLDIGADIMKKILDRETGTIMEVTPEEEMSMAQGSNAEYRRIDSDYPFKVSR